MSIDNIIPSGSVTKTVTAMSIMKLYEQGKIDLNDTIDKHVDEILMKVNGSTI